MSELQGNPPSTPPEGPTSAGVVLTPPDAVPEVQEDQAIGMVAVPPDKRAELQGKAQSFVDELAALEPGSPEFTRKITDITRLGEREIRSSAETANRMLERPSPSLAAARGRNAGPDAQTQVARALQDLRTTITDLDPARADLSAPKRALIRIPGGRKLSRYFERYQSAQKQLDAIITSLMSGQDELLRDNAAIEHERATLWTTMGTLAEYNALATALDGATTARIAELRASDPARADAMTADALFPIRQRRQDLTRQIAVSVQGYLALDAIRRNNAELITAVERARTTTISALRTAVVVAAALENQRLVLDQISALNDTTDSMIGSTSELLKQQTARVHEQASSSGVSVDTLQRAFDNVFSTMDAIDTYRATAVEAMAVTVDALEHQVARSRSYLDRSHSGTSTGSGTGTGTGTGAG
ncbi:toxic anion resistance protein [Leifsonia sp. LS-T14]|uniref:toxic anion resistance protein n=1 Tax=unclassified Leifsonia TaxID=2663824 RepID=UPI0035A693B3